jgi:hypothetical protein
MTENNYAVALYTNGDVEVITLTLDLGTQINDIVGGYFECITLRTEHGEFDMWLNEEGKLNGLPINHYATELFHMYFSNADVIVGNVLLTGGVDRDGNTLGLSQEQVNLFLPNTKEN